MVGPDGETTAILDTAAAHWSARSTSQGLTRVQWWQYPPIVRHINARICGKRVAGTSGGDVALLTERVKAQGLGPGVSVGCGSGGKEMALLRAGVVEHFDLYEISERRIALGRKAAEGFGLEDRITWHREIMDFTRPLSVDLVYWNNALHHMLDTRQALAWSRASLRPGGVFYLNDFVGPNRMQWSDEMLEIAGKVRAALPARLLRRPDGSKLPPRVGRRDAEQLTADDPTECADSAAILPGIARNFPDAEVRLTGGLVYNLALRGILENLTDEDSELLELLLLVDDLMATEKLTHYTVAIATV